MYECITVSQTRLQRWGQNKAPVPIAPPQNFPNRVCPVSTIQQSNPTQNNLDRNHNGCIDRQSGEYKQFQNIRQYSSLQTVLKEDGFWTERGQSGSQGLQENKSYCCYHCHCHCHCNHSMLIIKAQWKQKSLSNPWNMDRQWSQHRARIKYW